MIIIIIINNNDNNNKEDDKNNDNNNNKKKRNDLLPIFLICFYSDIMYRFCLCYSCIDTMNKNNNDINNTK